MAAKDQEGDAGGMDLQTFVSETLVQIVGGVGDAIGKIGAWHRKGMINPFRPDHAYGRVDDVEFDVAVTVTDRSGGKVGGGLKVVGLELGVKGERATENVAVSRVRFSVPVAMPHTEEPRTEQPAQTESEYEDQAL